MKKTAKVTETASPTLNLLSTLTNETRWRSVKKKDSLQVALSVKTPFCRESLWGA